MVWLEYGTSNLTDDSQNKLILYDIIIRRIGGRGRMGEGRRGSRITKTRRIRRRHRRQKKLKKKKKKKWKAKERMMELEQRTRRRS